MSVMRLPTGISVDQAKKDAKKLAKELDVNLSEAQDAVAQKHSRSSWAAMMNMLNNHHQLSVSLKQSFFTKEAMKFPGHKSLTTVVGQSGSGKTLLLLEFASQWLKLGVPVVYIGLSGEERNQEMPDWMLDVKAASALRKRYGNLVRFYSWNVTLSDLKLDGAVLILEEPYHLLSKNDPHDYRALINTSLHTFIGCQSIDETKPFTSDLKNISDDNLHFIVLPTHEYDWERLSLFNQRLAEAIGESDRLERKANEFTEFLSISKTEVGKLRFRLKDHSAL